MVKPAGKTGSTELWLKKISVHSVDTSVIQALQVARLALVAPNTLNREFSIDEPNKVWVTDFTYIRTYEGWLFADNRSGFIFQANCWLEHESTSKG